MIENLETTYSVKTFSGDASDEIQYADFASATAAYELVEKAYYTDEESPWNSAYLFAITGGKRVILRTFDRGYDEYLQSCERTYKCIYCGKRSPDDDTIVFYCYAGPRGEHHYELVDGDE